MQPQSHNVNIFHTYAVERPSAFDVSKLTDRFIRRNVGWSIPEAFLCVLISAAMSDGHFDPSEIALIHTLAKRSRALSSLSDNDLALANKNVNEKRLQPGALEAACATLPADMCLPIFAHCVDVILSDGQLLKPEAEWLQKLVPMLDIDRNDAVRVLEVLLLKAQY